MRRRYTSPSKLTAQFETSKYSQVVSTDPVKALPGLCGCGTPDIDINNNGTVDCTEVGLKLPQPRSRVIDGRVMVQLPKKAGVRFDYTYTFLNRTKLLITGSRRAESAATLSFKVPRNATTFSLQYVAKGPLYRDYTSPKYKRTRLSNLLSVNHQSIVISHH